MKKIFYFTLLTFLLLPFAVKAEINLNEIHNNISKDNKIEIKSIPLKKYKESRYYESCVNEYSSWDENAENSCLDIIYGTIVTSYLYKNHNFSDEASVSASCEANNNTCIVEVFSRENDQERLYETYDITFIENADNKINNIAKNSMNGLNKNYSIDDMGYINQLINYDNIENYFTAIQGNTDLFKMFPEIKKHVENNHNIEYIPVFGAGGFSPLVLGGGGNLVAYYNDVVVGISDNFLYSTYRIINISDKTATNTEAYINEALKRIKEYINDDSYKINISYDKETTDSFCEGVDCNYSGYKTKVYKLTINNKEYTLGIAPTDEKNIKKLKIESKDYENDISVETESSDFPLDTSVKAEDLTIKYKGFLKAYDIDLYSGIKDEYITKIKDGIMVRIPLPDEYNKKKLEIYHIKEDGKKGEKYQAIVEEIDGKKYAVFTTNHFSIYAIENNNIEEIKNPNTYDDLHTNIILLGLSIIGLVNTVYYLKKQSNII